MKVKLGYFKQGDCWRFIPSFNRYWAGKIWWFSFWRFFVTLDFRKDFVGDMMHGIRQ